MNPRAALARRSLTLLALPLFLLAALPLRRGRPALPAAPVAQAVPDELRPASAPAAADSAPVVPVAARPRSRVLVLGDSMVFGHFGQSLQEQLHERGADVWLRGSCGASSVSFLRGIRSECGAVRDEPGRPRERVTGPAPTPKLEPLLDSIQPDVALLVLGTNFLCCAAEAAPDVRELVDRLRAARVGCLWVGLPSFRSPPSRAVGRHYAMLSEALGDRCELLDARSLGIPFRDVGDQVHVDPVSGRQWAEAVVEAVTSRWLPPR